MMMARNLCSMVLATLLMGCGSASRGALTDLGPGTPFRLTVLHNNDANSALLEQGDDPGVARFATQVNRLRQQSVNPILLSAGGNVDAVPTFQVSREQGVPFFESQAMQLLGYAASGLGYGEFYFGPDVLADFVGGLPFVSSNLDFSQEPVVTGIVSSRLLSIGGQVVAVVGVTASDLAAFSTPGNVQVLPELPALQNEIDRLTAVGVNKVIALGHLGSLERTRQLARNLRDVDLMVAGSDFEILANPTTVLRPGDLAVDTYPTLENDASGRALPIVLTGPRYGYVGRVVLEFDAQGVVSQVGAESGPVRVVSAGFPDGVEPDPTMETQVLLPLAQELAQFGQQVVATTQVALRGLDADLRTRETNQGNLISDALLAEARRLASNFGQPLAQVTLLNSGGVRNNSLLPVGALTQLDLSEMLPFASFLVVVPQVPAAQLKELLENSVSTVELQEGRFAQVAGLRFSWDPAGVAQQSNVDGVIQVAGTRIRQVTLDSGEVLVTGGAVVANAPAVNLATLDFMARGGDFYPFRGAAFTALGVTYQEATRRFLQQDLGGVVLEADYPDAGEGRITRLP